MYLTTSATIHLMIILCEILVVYFQTNQQLPRQSYSFHHLLLQVLYGYMPSQYLTADKTIPSTHYTSLYIHTTTLYFLLYLPSCHQLNDYHHVSKGIARQQPISRTQHFTTSWTPLSRIKTQLISLYPGCPCNTYIFSTLVNHMPA